MNEADLGIEGMTVVEMIGRGGFGAVYRVRDETHGREVAVKVLPALLDDSARRQFDRERRAMGVLSDHPGIGTVHTSGFTTHGEPYIAMQLMRGGSLADRIAKGPMPVGEALSIGAAMADALQAAHEAGVLHLDVKPENILFTSHGEPKLVDFGIATLADDTRATSTIRATPAFAAPEVLEGQPATPAADVYSLGVTLYAAIAGQAPFAGDSMLTVLRRIAVEPVPVIDRPDVPAPVVDLLHRAMDKSPAGRPASMAAFAAELRALQANVDTVATDDAGPSETVTFAAGAPLVPTDSGVVPPPPITPSGGWTPPANPSGPVTPSGPVPPGAVPPGDGALPPLAPPDGPPPGEVPYDPPKKKPMGLIIGGVAAAVALLLIGLVLVNRGGSDDGEGADVSAVPENSAASVTTEAPETTEATATTDAPESSTVATTSFDAIQPSVIQIEAVGSIRDPAVGVTTQAGRGSGFIISDDGLAVTNNHVVTGAATLEVFLGGDSSKSYNATVLGVSECNDLAVIDIDEDAPLTPLEWYQGEVTPGLDVYAAGFPLGDPQYTLTRGVISKVGANGETSFASLDSVLEHDANIQPGNSGGPLVAADGTVVGINFAGSSPSNTDQFFAIDKDTAQEVIEVLKSGDFESLGVNGDAFVDDTAGISGIWVSGIAPGSPADAIGMLPGDIIQTMNGIPIGSDGTKADYCDVIRTSGANPIKVEVLRYDTGEIFTGEINGDKPLELTFSPAQAVEEETTVEESATTYDSYTTIVDDTGTLTVDVPTAWTSIDTTPITLDDGSQLGQITASPDIEAYNTTWDVPGIFYTSVPQAGILDALATFDPGDACTDAGQTEYQDAAFLGTYQVWTNCGGTDTIYVVLAAAPLSGTGNVSVLTAQIVTDADLDALDQAFATFNTTS